MYIKWELHPRRYLIAFGSGQIAMKFDGVLDCTPGEVAPQENCILEGGVCPKQI
jgi:hypothetical protein